MNLTVLKEKPERKELFNFKDPKAQQKFKNETSVTKEFTECFETNLPLDNQIEKWRQVLKSKCSKSFKKIRINGKRKPKPLNQQISQLITLRNNLLGRKCEECELRTNFNSKLRSHIEVQHTGSKNICEECDFQANRGSQLKVHVNMEHEGV